MPKALSASSRTENLANPMVGLLTDFGLLEPYVAQMKGVILKHAPNIQFIDITHNVPAFKVRLGAHFLAETVHFFPPNSTFLGVVDPEVGSSRDLVALQNDGHTFFAPNNGLLSLIPRQPDAKLWKLKFEAGHRLDKGKITLLKFMGNEYPLFSANYYSQVPENTLALIAGSQGFMEIAMNQASAAKYLNFTFEMLGTAAFSIVL